MVDSNATRKTFVVPDITPVDQYDFTRAKICASVGWLLAKSYGNAGMYEFAIWFIFVLPLSYSSIVLPVRVMESACMKVNSLRCVHSAIFLAHKDRRRGGNICLVAFDPPLFY